MVFKPGSLVYMATPIDVVVLKCKIFLKGNGWNRALFTSQKKISALSETVATAWIAPKVCQREPPTFGSQCSKFHPNRFTFGGAEQVKAVLLAHRVNPWFASNTCEANNKLQRNLLCCRSWPLKYRPTVVIQMSTTWALWLNNKLE